MYLPSCDATSSPQHQWASALASSGNILGINRHSGLEWSIFSFKPLKWPCTVQYRATFFLCVRKILARVRKFVKRKAQLRCQVLQKTVRRQDRNYLTKPRDRLVEEHHLSESITRIWLNINFVTVINWFIELVALVQSISPMQKLKKVLCHT